MGVDARADSFFCMRYHEDLTHTYEREDFAHLSGVQRPLSTVGGLRLIRLIGLWTKPAQLKILPKYYRRSAKGRKCFGTVQAA